MKQTDRERCISFLSAGCLNAVFARRQITVLNLLKAIILLLWQHKFKFHHSFTEELIVHHVSNFRFVFSTNCQCLSPDALAT